MLFGILLITILVLSAAFAIGGQIWVSMHDRRGKE
jgi:hypothetical protein